LGLLPHPSPSRLPYKNQINPEEHPIMLTEIFENKKKNKEKMVEIMFENF